MLIASDRTLKMKTLIIVAAATAMVIGTVNVSSQAQAGTSIGIEIGYGGVKVYPAHYRGHYRHYHHGRYNYGSRCRWLKRKARRTGSSYWWRRYNYCMWSYYW